MQGVFFGKKTFIAVLTSSLVCFGLLQVVGIVLAKKDHDRRMAIEAAAVRQHEGRPAEVKAVERAGEYLRGSVPGIDPATRLILDYVQRRFDLPDGLSKDAYPIGSSIKGTSTSDEIEYVMRIAYPDRLRRTVPPNISDKLMVTNIYSANCDHLTPPESFWTTMRENAGVTGYSLTHTALAFSMIKDNGCKVPDDIAAMRPLVFNKMARIAGNQGELADLRYEAAALLLLNGKRDLVEKSWIDQIVKEQRDDGGWAVASGGSSSDPHATLLAMWAILEYANPDKPYDPLIRRPS